MGAKLHKVDHARPIIMYNREQFLEGKKLWLGKRPEGGKLGS